MAVAVFMNFPGLSQTQYNGLMADLNLDVNPPVGEILHVAAQSPDGTNVCDLWQTREAAESFVERRLRPAMRLRGINAHIVIDVLPLHNLFVPDMDTIERIGAVSLPAHEAGAAL